MNPMIKVIKISEALKAKSAAGRISLRFNTTCTRLWPTRRITFTVFLPRFSRLFVSIPSRILQNNLLEIRRYKLSFFAKAVTYLYYCRTDKFSKLLREAQNTMGAGTRHIITRDDVVSQRLKFGSTFLRSQKLPCFFNFPVSRTRPEKIV